MWAKFGLILLVGLAAATNDAWLPNTEYSYRVRSRALTYLDIADLYTGVFQNARLTIKTGNFNAVQNCLTAKLEEVKVTRMHNVSLPNGWESDVDLKYSNDLELTKQPFNILIKDNVISGLEVSADMPKWEANIIKGIVSQLQINIRKDDGCTYKIMEPTVTGEYETLYELCGDDNEEQQTRKEIFVSKTKNFEKNKQYPSVHYGFADLEYGKPNSNQMGKFFTKSSVSRAVLRGDIHRYNISTSETVNEVSVSPTFTTEKRAVVGSKVNVTLERRVISDRPYEQPENLVKISLVYEMGSPFSKNIKVNPKQHLSFDRFPNVDPKSAQFQNPPATPLISEFVGFYGDSIALNDQAAFIKSITKVLREIAQELQRVDEIPRQQTMSKYAMMIRVIATLNKDQMKQLGEELYADEKQDGQKRMQWQVYRDIIAEAPTLPAYQTIKEWIKERKMEGQEAAQVLQVSIGGVATPTEEFVRDVFEFTKEVMKQRYVNDSAILACSSLMRKVYIDQDVADQEYPVYAFGNFGNQQGKRIVTDDYIPYLTRQLQQAIDDKDNHAMNVYIRALGNVAHKTIMESFEIFWSHEKAPVFQRVQSIIALNKVAKIYPRETREVCFRLYNSDQLPQEMRIAAVYQIMRTNPPKAILQQMARKTSNDENEYVNSAVQSAIREAAQCKIEECRELSQNANAAVNFLTKEVYGQQYAKQYLRDYVTRNVDYLYKTETIPSKDSHIPKAFKTHFSAIVEGLKDNILDVEGAVCSVDELLTLFQMRSIDQSREHSNGAIPELSINEITMGHLQAMLRYSWRDIESVFSFDNQTFTATIQELERDFRDKKIQINKIFNQLRYVAAPLEIGSFYTFSIDYPVYLSARGKINFEAQPSISNGHQIQNVKNFELRSTVQLIVSQKLESRLTIVTPFDHHEYATGYDKNLQVNLPVEVYIKADVKDNKYKVEMEPLPKKSFNFFHYSTQPFIGHRNILNLEPTTVRPDTHVIIASPVYNHEKTYFQQSGIAVRVNSTFEHPIAFEQVLKKYQKQGLLVSMMSFFNSQEVDSTEFTLSFDHKESVGRKVKVEFGKRNLTKRDLKEVEEKSGKTMNLEQLQDNQLYYVDIEVKGEQKVQYKFKAGVAQDNVSIKNNYFIAMQKESNAPQIKPYQAVAFTKFQLPNTPELSLKAILDMDLSAKGEYFACVGQTCDSKIKGPFSFRRSEERQQYLAELSEKRCLENEIQQCQNLTIMAGLLNQYDVKIEKENSEELFEAVNRVYDVVRRAYNLNHLPWFVREVEEIQADFSVDLNQVNITAVSHGFRFSTNFIPVDEMTQRLVVVHPSYPLVARLAGKYFAYKTYYPTCSIEDKAINTFDDLTYPTEKIAEGKWYLAAYYNRSFTQAPEEDQRITYAILVSKNQNRPIVQIKMIHPKTKGQLSTVELITEKSTTAIKINGHQQQWNQTEAGQDNSQLVRFYGNSKEEITVDVSDDLYVVYNGKSVQIGVTSDRMRGALKGLCGTNDGLKNTDFTVPEGCVAKKDFVKAYQMPVEESETRPKNCQEQERRIAEILGGLRLGTVKNAKRSF